MSIVRSAQAWLEIARLGGVLLFLCVSSSASAQKMSAGLVVGRSLTGGFRDLTEDYFLPPLEPDGSWYVSSARFWSRSKDFVAGGMVEVRLNPHWSLEVNALFRELRGQSGIFHRPEESPKEASPHQIVTWQFPVLAKYRFRGRKINPFVAAGPSFRTVGNVGGPHGHSHHGIAAEAGFEKNWRGLKIAPAVRYTLWAGDKSHSPLQTAPDQVEILVGFSRASEENWRPLGRRVSLGFTLGVNVTGDYPATRTLHELPSYPEASYVATVSGARSLMYGPTVEVRLPHRFSVEAGALHRPIGRTEEVTSAYWGRTVQWTSRLVTWVFPVLAKHRFPLRGPAPFIALGPSFRMRQSFKESSPYGLAAAVGLEVRVGSMRIAPAIRYTHWAADRLPGGPRRSQAEALVGFSF